ncbi:hypothetical protein BY458DRAFT_527045 [Sporodiniella umbellata]|nr:hypothetical protein BY458DRAFT_527045 [Sporodiniella umbellata]
MSIQCSYIGLGNMGYAMAGHIAQGLSKDAQPRLWVHNRTLAKADMLATTHPVVPVSSLETMARGSDVIFSCLLNDAAVQSTLDGLIPFLKPGAIVVEQSTISPELSQSLAQRVHNAGGRYLACPILGPPAKAKAQALIVLVAGDQLARKTVLPLLIPAIGSQTIELGQDPAASVRLKLCGNFVVTGLVELVSEYMTLAEASGVGQANAQSLIDAFLPGSIVATYASRISEATFKDQIHFPISSAIKDATHIVTMAQQAHAPVPITHTFLNHCHQVLENHGDYDLTGVVMAHREKAELSLE